MRCDRRGGVAAGTDFVWSTNRVCVTLTLSVVLSVVRFKSVSVTLSVLRFQLVSVMHPKDLMGLASFGITYRTLDGVEGDRQPDILTEDNAA